MNRRSSPSFLFSFHFLSLPRLSPFAFHNSGPFPRSTELSRAMPSFPYSVNSRPVLPRAPEFVYLSGDARTTSEVVSKDYIYTQLSSLVPISTSWSSGLGMYSSV